MNGCDERLVIDDTVAREVLRPEQAHAVALKERLRVRFISSTAACEKFPSRIGNAPVPYAPMVMRLALVPADEK